MPLRCEPVCPTYRATTPTKTQRTGLQPMHRHTLFARMPVLIVSASSISGIPFGTGRWNFPSIPTYRCAKLGLSRSARFCVQRHQMQARNRRRRKTGNSKTGKSNRPAYSPCPASALVFGDLNDPESEVSRLSRSSRGTKLLEDLGTLPKVTLPPAPVLIWTSPPNERSNEDLLRAVAADVGWFFLLIAGLGIIVLAGVGS